MTLTTALVILGLVVLAALALQAWWAIRRIRPREPAEGADSAMRVEPSLHDTEPALAEAPAAVRMVGKPVTRLDALIDAIAPLALDDPVTGDLVLQHMPTSRRAGNKPFYVEGLDTESGEWDSIAPGRRYSELQAGVQLANRSGPLNAIEYSEFVQKLQALADAVGATADVPDMLDVVARARELDALSAPLDAQLSVTLRTNGVAWSVGFVQQVAGRLGLLPGVLPGRLVMPSPDDGAPPMLVLEVDPQAALAEDPQAAVVRECTLTLDVPQTPASQEPFPAWHLTGKQLADDLDATAVDDQGQNLTLHAYDAIGKELDELYRRLEDLDLAAGTPAARRLFS